MVASMHKSNVPDDKMMTAGGICFLAVLVVMIVAGLAWLFA